MQITGVANLERGRVVHTEEHWRLQDFGVDVGDKASETDVRPAEMLRDLRQEPPRTENIDAKTPRRHAATQSGQQLAPKIFQAIAIGCAFQLPDIADDHERIGFLRRLAP